MKPDFFILGAPKTGTTALASYLSDHPHVCMCDLKEPHYFNTDHSHDNIASWEDYLSLFSNENQNILATGEASVWYLYSEIAVSNIEKVISEPKYIVILRNPYTLATSLHAQHLYSGYENHKDFNMAWAAQTDNSLRKKVPANCPSIELLKYADICCLGKQLNDLYHQIPADRIHIIFQDDLTDNPQIVWSKVQQFLELPPDLRTSFPKLNTRKHVRFNFIRKAQLSFYKIRKDFGLTMHPLGIGTLIKQLNITAPGGGNISTLTAKHMYDIFDPDIVLLSKITGRDLTAWQEYGLRLTGHDSL